MRQLVVGLGEVGSAVFEVLNRCGSDIVGVDKGDVPDGTFDVLHVCLPWSDQFHDIVRAYQQTYGRQTTLTVIHSTVPWGTSEELGAVHSPVRGTHPHLVEGLLTFVKYFGGPRAADAAALFDPVGIQTFVCADSRTTEALKLWDTTYYGWNIVFMQAVAQWCARHQVDFGVVYDHANRTYNQGYEVLDRQDVCRPVLKYAPPPIGGHCILPNCDFLADSAVAHIIRLMGGR